MKNFTNHLSIALSLLAVALFFQSCKEQSNLLEKQKVQFILSRTSSGDETSNMEVPENTFVRMTMMSSNGAAVFSDKAIKLYNQNGFYVTELIEVPIGAYTITDFLVVNDDVDLYVIPKKGSEGATAEMITLPYDFSISENTIDATVRMSVVDVRNQDLKRFGYTSKTNSNFLSLAVYNNERLTSSTAELWQNKQLLKTISLTSSVNTIALEGDHKLPYTLTVYTTNAAKTQTFNIKDLKKQLGKKPLKIELEPALLLTIHSYVDEGNEYEEFFNFRMEGEGSVNINWGDGEHSAATLPFEIAHEYFTGTYTAIVTGNIEQATDFSGFSYGSIIYAINGLTNLTSLKVYNPSWGAVPIKVDLSNCKQLEEINIAKYGAPYEPCDLTTDFKLPSEHNIKVFVFDAPSFDSEREFISAEELEVMVTNIYNNVLNREIYNGAFYVNPVVTPNAATQQKIDVLKNEYAWQVGFNDDIYNIYNADTGRSAGTSLKNSSREQWLRQRFSNAERIIERGEMVSAMY